eukprot:gene19987-1027_t
MQTNDSTGNGRKINDFSSRRGLEADKNPATQSAFKFPPEAKGTNARDPSGLRNITSNAQYMQGGHGAPVRRTQLGSASSPSSTTSTAVPSRRVSPSPVPSPVVNRATTPKNRATSPKAESQPGVFDNSNMRRSPNVLPADSLQEPIQSELRMA